MLKSPSEALAEAYAAYYTHADELPSYIRRYFDDGEWKTGSGTKVLTLDEWYKKLLDNGGESGIMNTTTNAVCKAVQINNDHSNSLTGPPNGIVQRVGKKGGIDRNYYDKNGNQIKQVSNNGHGNKSDEKLGEHGEHAHDYLYNENGELIKRSRSRELNDEERKENADIL